MKNLEGSRWGRETFQLAGWLFADLLLGTSILFLILSSTGFTHKNPISLTTFSSPTSTTTFTSTPLPSQTPTAKPSSTPQPSPTATPLPQPTGTLAAPGLGKPQCYNIDLPSANVSVNKKWIIDQLAAKIPNNAKQRTGLLLTWVHGDYDKKDTFTIATEIENIIRENFSESFSNDTQYKKLYFDSGAVYHVQLEVYFFTDNPWLAGKESKCEMVR